MHEMFSTASMLMFSLGAFLPSFFCAPQLPQFSLPPAPAWKTALTKPHISGLRSLFSFQTLSTKFTGITGFSAGPAKC